MNDTQANTAFGRFWTELRRRHVVRFSLGYAAAAFVVLQLAEIVFPAFGLGEVGLRILVVAVALGFPPAAVLAWVFDITTEGLTRTEGTGTDGLVPRLALLVVTVAVMSGLGVWLATVGVFSPPAGLASGSGDMTLVQFDPEQPIRSIAVLPLDDFSPDGDQAYFTAGMHEELIAKLSLVEGLRVVSRTSAMQYAGTSLSAPQIGRDLNVEALLEGSVTRAGDRVRITLQIIHAPSDSHIRTLQFDREVNDFLALQTEIAHMVVHEIKGEHEEEVFERVAMDAEPDAQEAYLRGRMEYDRGTPDGYRMALDYFEDAVEADPYFAPAMAGVAGSRFLVGVTDQDADSGGIEQAYSEAMKAVEMDSASFEAREVLSLIERSLPRIQGTGPGVDPPTEPKQIHIVRLPGSPEGDSVLVDMTAYDTAWVSAVSGLGQRIEESVRRSMSERDPSSRGALEARQLMTAGQFLGAVEVLEGVVEDSPHSSRAWDMLARSHVSAGDAGGAVEAVRRWRDSGDPRAPDADAVESLQEAVSRQGARGYWAWTLDRLASEGGRGRPGSLTEMAAANAGLGNHEEAFRLLFDAIERGEPDVLMVRSDPVFDELRGDPRFRELLQQARQLRFAPTPTRGGRAGRGGGR